MEMTIHQESSDPSRRVLVVSGSIDLASRGALMDSANQVLAQPGFSSLVLDLAGISFMDSTGVGAIVSIAASAADVGSDFRLRAPSKQVRRLLEVTALLDEWPID